MAVVLAGLGLACRSPQDACQVAQRDVVGACDRLRFVLLSARNVFDPKWPTSALGQRFADATLDFAARCVRNPDLMLSEDPARNAQEIETVRRVLDESAAVPELTCDESMVFLQDACDAAAALLDEAIGQVATDPDSELDARFGLWADGLAGLCIHRPHGFGSLGVGYMFSAMRIDEAESNGDDVEAERARQHQLSILRTMRHLVRILGVRS